jgi:hypothetical protein
MVDLMGTIGKHFRTIIFAFESKNVYAKILLESLNK